jgi:hypothetical protein
MTSIIWFNEDGINPEHQMVQDNPNALRVYIFDVPYLQQWNISKHRVQFIYESLLEIPDIQIYRGETVSVLKQLVAQHHTERVVTTGTPNHLIKTWQSELRQFVDLTVYPEIYPVSDNTSPRRFARYWRKHERAWLSAGDRSSRA